MGRRYEKYRRAWKLIKEGIDWDEGTGVTFALCLCPRKYREILFIDAVNYIVTDMQPCYNSVAALLAEPDFDVGLCNNRLWRCAVEQVCVGIKDMLLEDERLNKQAPEVKAWFLTDEEFTMLYPTPEGERILKTYITYMQKALKKIHE